MSLAEDLRRGAFLIRGAFNIRDSTAGSIQNAHQGLSYDLQPAEFSLAMTGFPTVLFGVSSSSTTVNTLEGIGASQNPNSEVALVVTPQGAPITMSAPANATSTNASTQMVAANAARRYLWIENNDPTNFVWVGLNGNAAVVNKGIMLAPNGGYYEMTMGAGNVSVGQVTMINSGGSTNPIISIQEGI